MVSFLLAMARWLGRLVLGFWRWLTVNHGPVTAVVGIVAICFSIQLPIHQSYSKALCDLVAARNLAYLAERLSEKTLNMSKYGTSKDVLSSPEYDFQSSIEALKTISFKDIAPQYLTPYFVDIWYVANQAQGARDIPEKFNEKLIEGLIDRAVCNMKTIDSYLDELDIPHVNDDHWGDYGRMYYVPKDHIWDIFIEKPLFFSPKPLCVKRNPADPGMH